MGVGSDADYLAAVEVGDMKKAQEMVDQKADSLGYEGPLYHGSDARFNEFDLGRSGSRNPDSDLGTLAGGGVSFSPDKGAAARYGEVGKYYLNMSHYAVAKGTGMLDASAEEVARRIGEFRKANPDISVIVLNGGFDGIEVVAFDPKAIKSGDRVTYDDNKQPIPLSQRFNPSSNDIRY